MLILLSRNTECVFFLPHVFKVLRLKAVGSTVKACCRILSVFLSGLFPFSTRSHPLSSLSHFPTGANPLAFKHALISTIFKAKDTLTALPVPYVSAYLSREAWEGTAPVLCSHASLDLLGLHPSTELVVSRSSRTFPLLNEWSTLPIKPIWHAYPLFLLK